MSHLESNSVFGPDAKLIYSHTSESRNTAARLLVQGLLVQYPAFALAVGPTVPAAFENALLLSSFCSLAQELEDAAAPIALIIDFRRQWRRFHGLPEAPHGRPIFVEAFIQPTFGAAVAVFVDKLHVTDAMLDNLIASWRDQQRSEPVSEHPGSSVSSALEAMGRLALS
ncbi:hypothetical protein DFH06DRAFT_1325257 [Mycena polygramma]|nr:hypothetical protein DFH06DRAFT_1325257 [Mycena polygramma]